jgi:hypothetical protein
MFTNSRIPNGPSSRPYPDCFTPAERHPWIRRHHGVDEDHAGLELRHESRTLGLVPGPHARAEAEGGIVGDADRLSADATRKSSATGPKNSSRLAGESGPMPVRTVGW